MHYRGLMVPGLVLVLLTGCQPAPPTSQATPDDRVRVETRVTRASAKPADDLPADDLQRPDPQGSTAVRQTSQSTPANRAAADQPGADQELRILHWNIESGGNRPALIARQLTGFARLGYHIIALSEVEAYRLYQKTFESTGEPGRWKWVLGASGINDRREDDRLMVFYDSRRLELITSSELNRYREHALNSGRHRSPLVVHFECRESRQPFLLLHNHLARGDAEFRTEQAKGLREFARDNPLPQIAVGDYNFDYVFETRQGNDGFVEMLRDNIWQWVEPAELIDTNWFDPEPDGLDNYPGSMLDFTFVAGPAREWGVTSRVIVRDGDFPDDRTTSDHRPVEVVVPLRPTGNPGQ